MVHPELFELKALVAGRLDTHRRREIDDHLGSCAECSRHYVALMLGSASPKTAEAEARQGLVSTAAGSGLAHSGAAVGVPSYGIDAPLAPPVPRAPAARKPHSNLLALETEFVPAPARTQVPVSASLVDAIAKLRAESETADAAQSAKTGPSIPAPAPAAASEAVVPPAPASLPQPVAAAALEVTLAPEIIAPKPASSTLLEPSIFTPTPFDGVSLVDGPTSSSRTAPATNGTASVSPVRTAAPPELVVTFSSTPQRSAPYRAPATVVPVTPSADRDYVSQAIAPTALPLADDVYAPESVSQPGAKAKPMLMGAGLGAVALVIMLGISGYNYFKSSVSSAASAAAAAAAKEVEAAAARTASTTPASTPVPAAKPTVETRIVYVDRPVAAEPKSSTASAPAPSAAPPTPASVALPDVNVNTGIGDGTNDNSTQRSVTSELTRSARATATRTAGPRP